MIDALGYLKNCSIQQVGAALRNTVAACAHVIVAGRVRVATAASVVGSSVLDRPAAAGLSGRAALGRAALVDAVRARRGARVVGTGSVHVARAARVGGASSGHGPASAANLRSGSRGGRGDAALDEVGADPALVVASVGGGVAHLVVLEAAALLDLVQVEELGAVGEVDDGGLVVARGGAQSQLVVRGAGQAHNTRVGGGHSGLRMGSSDGGNTGDHDALHLEWLGWLLLGGSVLIVVEVLGVCEGESFLGCFYTGGRTRSSHLAHYYMAGV